jgi:hypothetical protein
VLKRDGRLLLTVPSNPRLRSVLRFETQFDPLGQHVRFFTRRSLARTLEATGFAPGKVARTGGMLVVRARRA